MKIRSLCYQGHNHSVNGELTLGKRELYLDAVDHATLTAFFGLAIPKHTENERNHHFQINSFSLINSHGESISCSEGTVLLNDGVGALICNITTLLTDSKHTLDALTLEKIIYQYRLPRLIAFDTNNVMTHTKEGQTITVRVVDSNHASKGKTLEVEVSAPNAPFERLDALHHHGLRLITLVLGKTPDLESISIYDSEARPMRLYRNLEAKYHTQDLERMLPISTSIAPDPRGQTIQAIAQFVDSYGLIVDVLLLILNSDAYPATSLAGILQCVEGYYRSTAHLSRDCSNYEIYEHLLSSEHTASLLSQRQRTEVSGGGDRLNFIRKLLKHRNFFTHLNYGETSHDTFTEDELKDALLKVSLAFRLTLLQDFGYPISDSDGTRVHSYLNQ